MKKKLKNIHNTINENIDLAISAFATGNSSLGYRIIQMILESIAEKIDIKTKEDIDDNNEIILINNILLKMMRAMENKDDVLLADILEYEIKNIM